MPKQYTPETKAEALYYLNVFQGDIQLAHIRTGIPQRTLRHWRQEQCEQNNQKNDGGEEGLLPEKKPSAMATKELQRLREELMAHVFAITATLSQDDENVNHRAIAISRLLPKFRANRTTNEQS